VDFEEDGQCTKEILKQQHEVENDPEELVQLVDFEEW
jgi:hypothetical protein